MNVEAVNTNGVIKILNAIGQPVTCQGTRLLEVKCPHCRQIHHYQTFGIKPCRDNIYDKVHVERIYNA